MEKDSQVKWGSTKCDLCSSPAQGARGKLVLCERHLKEHEKGVKSAAAAQGTLRAAPIMLADNHKQ